MDLVVTIAQVAEHLRIDNPYPQTDEMSSFILSAQQYVINNTGIDWTKEDEVPELIKAAILLLTGHYYANREAATPLNLKTLPLGVENIISQYKKEQVY